MRLKKHVDMPSLFAVETRGLSKRFGDCVSNDAIDLKVKSGRIHAVLGENGAGKSTLMKLLFGLETPTAGEIYIHGKRAEVRSALEAIDLGIGMVQQHFALVETATAIENIILGAEPTKYGMVDIETAIKNIESRLPSEALRVPWDVKVETLSVGFRQRIEILKIIYRRANLMIFDEPTAVLTPQESEDLYLVLQKLREDGKTIVLITHKIEDVLKHADDYSVLRRGKLVGSGEVKNTSMSELVELMIGRPLRRTELHSQAGGPLALQIRKLSVPGQLKALDLEIHGGEILGVAGIEGAGQKALVESLMGLVKYEGQIKLYDRVLNALTPFDRRELGVAYIPEDRTKDGLWTQGSSQNNIVPGREHEFFANGILRHQYVQKKAEAWFENFDVRAPSLETPAGKLSGGNQQKLILAREISEKQIRLLVSHQPTRGVDIGAIEKIQKCLLDLRDQKVAILLISSDLDELLTLSDRIVVLYEGQIAASFGQRSQFDLQKMGQAMTGVRLEK